MLVEMGDMKMNRRDVDESEIGNVLNLTVSERDG